MYPTTDASSFLRFATEQGNPVIFGGLGRHPLCCGIFVYIYQRPSYPKHHYNSSQVMTRLGDFDEVFQDIIYLVPRASAKFELRYKRPRESKKRTIADCSPSWGLVYHTSESE